MKSDQLQARTKSELIVLARKKGVEGWHGMRKEELVAALTGSSRKATRVRPRTLKGTRRSARPQSGRKVRPQTQRVAARNTSASPAEDQAERSKYDVGVPTKDDRKSTRLNSSHRL